MKKTKIELLDEVLSFISHTTTWLDIREHFPNDIEEMRTIIRKLRRDDYIDLLGGTIVISKDKEPGFYNEMKVQRNFEGDLFVEKGGYPQQQINLQNLAKSNKYQLKLINRSFFVNLFIAIATSIAAIYYLIEIGKYFHWGK